MTTNAYVPATTIGSYVTPEVTPITVPVVEAISPEPYQIAVPPTAQPTISAKVGRALEQQANNFGQMSFGQKASTIMDTVGSLMSAYNAYKANKLAKDQFNHAKEVHAKNWDAQRKQTNSQLADRQARRVAEAQANGRTTTSVGDYMAKYGI